MSQYHAPQFDPTVDELETLKQLEMGQTITTPEALKEHLSGRLYERGFIGQMWALGVVAEIVLFLFMARILTRCSVRWVLAASFLLAALIFIACLVTAVGLTCACAEFFAQYLPLSYRSLVFILGIFSMAVSNLGLSHLIQISIPVLTAIYPPCIALVVLSFTRNWWHNSSRVIAPAMFISLIFGILDGIKASAIGDVLPAWTQRLPLAEQGLAWLMPTVVMVVLAVIWDRAAGRQVTSSAH